MYCISHSNLKGKRSAEPYYGYGGYAAVVPKIEPVDSGYIVVPSSGAVVPDFTAEQKEEAPEGPADSANVSIKKLAVTGHEVIHPAVHLIGKRGADAYYGYGGYGGYGLLAPAVATVDTGLVRTGLAVTPDFTDAQKTADPAIADGSHPIKGVVVGKREADAYYGYGGYGAVVPKVEPVDSGFIVVKSSGAVVPDFTAEQKEAAPEGPADSANLSIKKLAVTGHEVIHPAVHFIGKREAEPWLLYGGANVPVAYDPATGLVTHSDGAVTPPYTPEQNIAAANLAARGLFYY